MKKVQGKTSGSSIILFLELLHTGDEKLAQIKFGRLTVKKVKMIHVLPAEKNPYKPHRFFLGKLKHSGNPNDRKRKKNNMENNSQFSIATFFTPQIPRSLIVRFDVSLEIFCFCMFCVFQVNSTCVKLKFTSVT